MHFWIETGKQYFDRHMDHGQIQIIMKPSWLIKRHAHKIKAVTKSRKELRDGCLTNEYTIVGTVKSLANIVLVHLLWWVIEIFWVSDLLMPLRWHWLWAIESSNCPWTQEQRDSLPSDGLRYHEGTSRSECLVRPTFTMMSITLIRIAILVRETTRARTD